MKKKVFIIVFFFVLFALILNVFTSFEKGDPGFEITTQYSQDETIKGWINISLKNETTDSLFTDSFNNSISLIELLNSNNNLEYDCLPSDCEKNYLETNPEAEKTFSLNEGESKIIGIKITGDNFENISDFSMNISSTAAESFEPQLYIDILDNNEFEWRSHTPSNNFHDEDYGCYDSSNETVSIHNQQYCEKINIPVSPNVEIGAYVIENPGGDVDFNMGICDENNANCNYCEATASTSGRISCISDEEIEERQDFFICINTKNIIDNNKYKINSETNNPCGFANIQENERDFEIFAKPGSYAAMNEFTLNNDQLQDTGSLIDLKFYIENYIERYDNVCTNGCIVPIKFLATKLQTITVSDLSVFYTSSGTPKEETDFYDITEIPAKITSDFQKIYLDDANLSVSGNFGETINYSLNLNNNEILTDEIIIERVPQITSIFPTTVIAAFPTEFKTNIETFNSSDETLNYEWIFGDGTTRTTSENKITHTYESLGTYSLKVSITNSESLSSSKTFNITVKTPKEAINSVLTEKLGKLENITSQINGLSLFQKDSLSKTLKLSGIETNLSSLQRRNATAVADNDYVNIMKDLVVIRIPDSVFKSEAIESVNFYPIENNINLEVLKTIAGGDFIPSEEDEYKKSVLSWYLENIDADINLKEFSVTYGDSIEKVLSFFQININGEEGAYFIIPQLDNLEFKENYQQREISEHVYIELTNERNEFEFSTTEDISFSELPAFVSPSISELPVISVEVSSENKTKFSKLTIFILSVILAFLIGFIAYIVIQLWYKRKYEDYLFKNKNNLYNIASYIESAKKRGLKNEEIKVKLKKSGWKPEQINYAMRKYAGKRTGMFEIPVDKILKTFKKEKHSTHSQNRS